MKILKVDRWALSLNMLSYVGRSDRLRKYVLVLEMCVSAEICDRTEQRLGSLLQTKCIFNPNMDQ